MQALRDMSPEKRQELRQKLMERRDSGVEEKLERREKMRENFDKMPPHEKQELSAKNFAS